MADAVRLGLTASRAANGRHGGQAASGAWRHGALAFHHVLAAAMAGARSPRATPVAGSGVQTAALHVPLGMAHPRWIEKPDSALPAQSDAALSHAMTLEGVPSSWQSGLRFIMAQESGGQVNARNPVHSARGLFQLTAANYHLNPERRWLIRQRGGGGPGRHPLHPAALRHRRQCGHLLAAAPLVLSRA